MPEENVRADRLGGTARRRNANIREAPTGGVSEYKYISADNHIDLVWYPRDIIQSRIAAKHREAAPKVVESDKGTAWQWEGDIHAFAADGRDWAKYAKRFDPIVVEEGTLPPADPQTLIDHMDIGEFYAGVFYGNTRKWTFKDKELEKAVYSAFNDWALEVCAYSPDRLLVLPWLHAAFPRNVRGRVVSSRRQGRSRRRAESERHGGGASGRRCGSRYGLAAERDGHGDLHAHRRRGRDAVPAERAWAVAGALLAGAVQPCGEAHRAVSFFNGMFDRHPNLHVSMAECRIGWLPFLFQWMERCYADRAPDSIHQLKESPLHYLKNNMSFTFEEDYIGAKMIPDPEFLIRDSVIWGCDYPHEQGQTWPDATPAMERMFTGTDPDLVHEVVWARAQRIFGIQGPDQD